MGRRKKIVEPTVVYEKPSTLSMIHQNHIEKYGWSGSCIKAYRIDNNMTRSDLAHRLHMRDSKLASYENEKRDIGIKFAKMLADIFKTDWHIFRKKPEETLIEPCIVETNKV